MSSILKKWIKMGKALRQPMTGTFLFCHHQCIRDHYTSELKHSKWNRSTSNGCYWQSRSSISVKLFYTIFARAELLIAECPIDYYQTIAFGYVCGEWRFGWASYQRRYHHRNRIVVLSGGVKCWTISCPKRGASTSRLCVIPIALSGWCSMNPSESRATWSTVLYWMYSPTATAD